MTDLEEDSQVEDTPEVEVFQEVEEDSLAGADIPGVEEALLEQDPQVADGDPHPFKYHKSTKGNW